MGVADNVDIVVLNCDNNGLIQQCVDSIRKNTHGYNLIIVDQNSKDGSKDWLVENEVAGHRIFNKRNAGVAEGRNQGIRAGKYNWVVLVDSDILIQDQNWLDKLWNYTIDRHIGLVEVRVNENGRYKFGALSFCMLRRQAFYEVGFFDGHFVIGEDKEWLARFENSRWQVAYCYDADITHVGGATMKGRLVNKAGALQAEADKFLQYKYSAEFLNATLKQYEARRTRKETELLNDRSNG